ncbi:MAG: sigma-70 family RNA polymerase sigma factor [Planctomycetota bacterium]
MQKFESDSDSTVQTDLWAACVLSHSGLFLGYATMLSGSRHAGADLVQDALLAVIRSGATPESPKAYLLQTIRRRAAEVARRKHAEPTTRALPITGAECKPSARESDCGDELWAAVAELPSSQCEIITLHSRGELTFREIAALLELPLGTVTSRYSRGLDTLRQQLGAAAPKSASR